jgi:serine/threonine protein kinase
MYNIAMKNNRNTRTTKKARRVKYKRSFTRKNRRTNGGNALASGGYGCIFSPSLKCANTKRETGKQQVSKLMLTNYAELEYKEANNLKKILSVVPDNEKYFLLHDITMCKPSSIPAEDLDNFTSKCTSLQKRYDINIDNINQSLDKLRIINMPNGGMTINEKVSKSEMSELNDINKSLIRLLKNGIVPMNKLKVFHCDAKDTNILIDGDYNSVLIDWGFAFAKKGNQIPKMLKRRPFQFNLPLSVILLSDEFNKMVVALKDKKQAEDIVTEYKEKQGHYEYINNMICLLRDEKDLVAGEQKYTFPLVVGFIYDILRRFSPNNVFDAVEYYNSEFINNVDLWGFIVTYLPLIKRSDKFKFLFENHLFKSGIINIDELYSDLEQITI